MRSASPPVKNPGFASPRQGFPWLVAGLLAAATAGWAQTPPGAPAPAPATTDLPSSAPVRLDLSRRDLKNFLADSAALAPYAMGTAGTSDLRDVFTLGSVDTRFAVFWDPLACRLVGILDLEAPPEPAPATATAPAAGLAEKEKEKGKDDDKESKETPPPAPSPYLLKAEGPFPLAKTAGASGEPRYFGFRLVKGVPEFLYTSGGLSIEERLWLDEGGKALKQRFSVKQASRGLQIAVPEAWKGRIAASAGTWKGTVLSVPKESAAEVVLTYPLAPAGSAPSPEPKSN